MLKQLSEVQLKELHEGLEEISVQCLEPLATLRDGLALIRKHLYRLDGMAKANPFADEAAEIDYHKNIYPKFRCLHILQVEVYLLQKEIEGLSPDMMLRKYEAQLEQVIAYAKQHEFHYSYYKLKANELDSLFFTFKGDNESVLLPILTDPEIQQTTAMGYLFAKFIAYELVCRYILDRLSDLAGNQDKDIPQGCRPMKWTGEAIHLIEVAHGIHLNKQVNNGKIGVVEFFDRLGEFFGVDLGIPKKGFDDLHKRKRFSKTKFTDNMRDSLLLKMDEEDDLQRKKSGSKKAGF